MVIVSGIYVGDHILEVTGFTNLDGRKPVETVVVHLRIQWPTSCYDRLSLPILEDSLATKGRHLCSGPPPELIRPRYPPIKRVFNPSYNPCTIAMMFD